MRKISILGSTGSIGTQALDVIRNNSEEFKVVGLSANSNIDLLYHQIIEFNPEAVSVGNKESASKLSKMLGNYKVNISSGNEGLIDIAELYSADIVLIAVVGMVGLLPTLSAIKKNKIIALANKETLVSGGALVKEMLEQSNAKIIPVDSEHCAIFQCMKCSDRKEEIKRIILTASGGPFLGKKTNDLKEITPQAAIKHPNWNMGKKISVDSSTLMNKGLEVIEAHWLFDMDFDKIDVIVHPQSIIHSMVEYIDGSIIAQMGVADMRNPILYALSYPLRNKGITKKLDFLGIKGLTFEEPDTQTFKCLKLAYEAGREGGTMPIVLNAANEVAVDLFLNGRIGFMDIAQIIEDALSKHIKIEGIPQINDIIEIDTMTKKTIYKNLKVV